MVSTISFIQANLQHSAAGSGVFTRTMGIKGIDMVLVQEPWFREDCIRGLNIPAYTLYSAGGKERPRACTLARNMNAWVLSELSCMGLVAILTKFIEDGAERRLVIVLFICCMIRRILPRQGRWRNLCDTVIMTIYA